MAKLRMCERSIGMGLVFYFSTRTLLGLFENQRLSRVHSDSTAVLILALLSDQRAMAAPAQTQTSGMNGVR